MKAFLLTLLIPCAALAAVVVTKAPSDEAVAACVADAINNVRAVPLECMQRTIVAGVCDDIGKPLPVIDADGYTYVGELRALPDGTSEESHMQPASYDVCWSWQFERVAPAPAVVYGETYVPTGIAPDAYDAEKQWPVAP